MQLVLGRHDYCRENAIPTYSGTASTLTVIEFLALVSWAEWKANERKRDSQSKMERNAGVKRGNIILTEELNL